MTEIDYSLNDPRNKWKILRTHWKYSLWAVFTSMGSMMLGSDYLVGGQLLPMKYFKMQFGEVLNGDYVIPSRYASAWSSIGPACDIVSALLVHPLMDKYGRKPWVLVGSVISVIGVLLQHLATEWKLHLAGRAINGVSIGIMFTISPLWIGETCRPELRGFFLCYFNTSIVVGQFLFVLISYGTEHIQNHWSWKIPLICQYIYPLILLSGFWWFPESPMWLIRNDNPERAKRSLRTMYGVNDERFYDMEVSRMKEEHETLKASEEVTLEQQRGLIWGLKEPIFFQCFKGTQLRRTFASILATSAQQLVGATFITSYVTYFLQLINISNYFLVSVILYVVMLISTFAAFLLVEMIGRRSMIVPSSFVLTGILLLVGIMGTIPNKSAGGWVIVVCIFLWALVYQVSVGASGFVVASEVATLRLRAANQSLVTVTNAIWGLVFQFTVPYMISEDSGNLGGKTGYIFFGTALIVSILSILMFFYLPETKGTTFATLDELFSRGVSARKFRQEGKKLTQTNIQARQDKKYIETEHIE